MNRKILKAGVVGTILAAICCFTPALVILAGALGLSVLVGYLDLVLLPILGLFVLVIIIGIVAKGKDAGES